ncbi:MAG: nuclear transport factor 2 family protein [Proteobacteria bacterium]|nr:nuclear transport factor 2 family protein [Pseudomonadota bacterium]
MSFDFDAIERIKRVKYLYCRGIDTCDIPLLESLFTEDASIDYQGGSYHFQAQGRDAILKALAAAFNSEFVACHTVHHPIIDVHSDGTAHGEWRLIDYALNLRENNLTTIGAATYRDHYVRESDGWKIQRATYTRIYERVFNDPNPALTFHLLGSKAA